MSGASLAGERRSALARDTTARMEVRVAAGRSVGAHARAFALTASGVLVGASRRARLAAVELGGKFVTTLRPLRVCVVVCAAMTLPVAVADAAFPGANGRI